MTTRATMSKGLEPWKQLDSLDHIPSKPTSLDRLTITSDPTTEQGNLKDIQAAEDDASSQYEK